MAVTGAAITMILAALMPLAEVRLPEGLHSDVDAVFHVTTTSLIQDFPVVSIALIVAAIVALVNAVRMIRDPENRRQITIALTVAAAMVSWATAAGIIQADACNWRELQDGESDVVCFHDGNRLAGGDGGWRFAPIRARLADHLTRELRDRHPGSTAVVTVGGAPYGMRMIGPWLWMLFAASSLAFAIGVYCVWRMRFMPLRATIASVLTTFAWVLVTLSIATYATFSVNPLV